MKRSIRTKFGILLLITTLVLGVSLIVLSSLVLRNVIDDFYKDKTQETGKILAAVLDPVEVETLKDAVMEIYFDSEEKVTSLDWGSDAFNAYVAQFEPVYDLPEYASVLEDMKKVQDNADVECVYLYATDLSEGNSNYIYVVDAAEEDACPVGCIDSYEWAAEQATILIAHPEAGFEAYITQTEEYGWLVSNMVPVFDQNGNVLLYACVDVSMDTIRSFQNYFTVLVVVIAAIIVLIVYLISVRFVNSNIVIPVKQLSRTAENYWDSGDSGVRNDFMNINISTNDEIEILSESMKKMESDINDYFLTLNETKKELSVAKEESESMKELAQRDSLTGIRNKTAYDKEVEKLEQDYREGSLDYYGIAMVDLNYLKRINDTYGHDKGNVAIKKVCKLVCDVFQHSPVFRVGGDEFVIVLKYHDLENIESLLQEFRERIGKETNDENLEMWERISAAIGYAVFDPETDKDTEDVFKRADDAMYQDKIRQKAERRE